jgi:hypothetical protein
MGKELGCMGCKRGRMLGDKGNKTLLKVAKLPSLSIIENGNAYANFEYLHVLYKSIPRDSAYLIGLLISVDNY